MVVSYSFSLSETCILFPAGCTPETPPQILIFAVLYGKSKFRDTFDATA